MGVQLYDYQKQYLSDMPGRAIFAADTGTGKTFMALAHYHKHIMDRPRRQSLLILAPASKVRTGDWDREIAEYFGTNPPEYKIYSYEKFSRDPKLWQQFSPAHRGAQHAIICDEVHRVKNPQSKMGKAVYQIARDASFFIGLSATPLPNGWIDAANYFKIFGLVRNITEFKRKYCNIQTFKGWPEIIGYTNEPELTRYWNSISKRLTKAEANDLPERTFIGVNFKKPASYSKLVKTRIAEDGTLLDTAPVLAHALRQELTAPKLAYLEDLLVGTTENVVIFYNYISERDEVMELLKKKDLKDKVLFRQDGGAHELPKKADWSGVENSITLAQYKSGSTGVEMTYATQVVYLSPTYSYSDYIQSIGRVHRNGQNQKTTFYNLRTTGSIEAAIYSTLKNKQSFQEKQWLIELEGGQNR